MNAPGGAEPIAIIGMRGRFPGASDLDGFWRNLAEGVESITFLTPEEARAAGVPEQVVRLPGYVNASPLLEGVDRFDAEFFGFSARDASLTDPQHRLFLETAWEALEDAGYDPARYREGIGVFGGCELSTYLYQLFNHRDSLGYFDGMQLMVTNDKDHLCTQVSYRLNLRGPSVVVQTTCSTSLVAVAMACESLTAGRCGLALAGGVTVRVPQRGGYLYTPGSILSPDGHCRPFDARAQGTIVGSGVGIVALKRLEEARADGDNVRAVILGCGLNNDGSDKVGYTAPSFHGQAGAIRDALDASGVSAETIGYVEAHGTGTILGDPIELAALTAAFRRDTDRRGFCGIGSVKSNFGHLSCASGVAGLIKAVLTIEHGAIPPTVHYRAPNPELDLAASPFYVTTSMVPWERNGVPRRAGVSSFGVGGTNAHLVLEEAPAPPPRDAPRTHQLLALSARSAEALDEAGRRLAGHLEAHPELELADVAFTLHLGRRAFPHRRALVVASGDRERAVAALGEPDPLAAAAAGEARPVVFMFPGQGAQYPGMAAELYRREPVVRAAIDRCAELLRPALGRDLRKLLFPVPRWRKKAAETLLDTALAQPALFTVEVALAALWRSWGIEPAAVIGHSVGELVAATVAGVMSLEDAVRLIGPRGRLISALPRGAMLSVMAAAEEVERHLDGEVALAAVNAPGYTVLSGPVSAIERVEAALREESIAARRLHTSHAFHSPMIDPILEEFEALVAGVPLSEPSLPMIATLKGTWAGRAVTEPGYWSAQLRSTVRFADGLAALTAPGGPAGPEAALLEVGPGRTLVTFAAQAARAAGKPGPLALATLPAPDERRTDTEVALGALGRLWAHGAEIDWEAFHGAERRARVSLPTYPFERRSYWIGTSPDPVPETAYEPRDPADWYHRPVWCEAATAAAGPESLTGRRILVFDEGSGLGAAVAGRLREIGARALTVRRGEAWERSGEDEYLLDPAVPSGFGRLAAAACAGEGRLAGVVDCWSAAPPGGTDLDAAVLETLLAPMRLASALSSRPTVRPLPVVLVARGTTRVDAGDPVDPPRALGAGGARVLPQEHPGLRVAHVDVDDDPSVAGLLLAELAAGAVEPAVALRRGLRFIEEFEPVAIDAASPLAGLPERPVVFITGGLGHMGLLLGEALFRRCGARLVLVGRRPLPAPDRWRYLCEDPDLSLGDRTLLRSLARLREERDEVLVLGADLNVAAEVEAAVEAAIEHFGTVDLVVHGAARIDPGAFAPVAETGLEVVEAQFSPKLRGLFSLIDAFAGREPARWVLHSSIATALGGLGLGAYSAANAVLDAVALAAGDRWLSIGWDAWTNAAEAQSAGMPLPIQPDEGQEAFLRLLGVETGSRLIVCAGDLAGRLERWVRNAGTAPDRDAGAELHPRPSLGMPFVAPRTETEKELAKIWGAQLGVAGVGAHDRFFDLGGHSLLAVQVASEIRDRFEIEMPVVQIFQAPTVSELAVLIDAALASRDGADDSGDAPAATDGDATPVPEAPPLEGDAPTVAAKTSWREFYDDVSRRLARSGVGESSFFLNYGYVSLGDGDEARFEVPAGALNPSSVRLILELVGATDLGGRRVLDVGSGRGGTVALLAGLFDAEVTGVDLSPEAVAFSRRVHRGAPVRFEVGDAEDLPFEDGSFDAVVNVESSHTYPNLRAFLGEVRRVLAPGGRFLYTDLLPVQRWAEARALLGSLGLRIAGDRHVTPNVLASCDRVAANRTGAFGDGGAAIENFLAVPGSPVYEQMRSGAWEYRIVRAALS